MNKMTYCCERCRRVTKLYYIRSLDEYLCDDCASEAKEPEQE